MTVLLRDDAGVLHPVLINVSADQIREIIEKAEECGRQLGSALSRCRLCGCHEGFGPKGQASASRISVEGWRGCVMRWAAVLFLILVVGVLYAEKPALGSIVPTAKIHPALEIQIIGVPDPPQDIKAPSPSFPIAIALSLRQKSLCLEGDRAGFACLQRRQHVLIAGLPRVGGLHGQREIRPVHLAMGFTNMSPRSADVHYLDVAADECSGMKEFGDPGTRVGMTTTFRTRSRGRWVWVKPSRDKRLVSCAASTPFWMAARVSPMIFACSRIVRA